MSKKPKIPAGMEDMPEIERLSLLLALVQSPRRAVEASGLTYDVLRSAALSGHYAVRHRMEILRAACSVVPLEGMPLVQELSKP